METSARVADGHVGRASTLSNPLLVVLICAIIRRRHQRKGTPMAARTDFNSVQLSKPSTGMSRQSSFLCLFVLLIGLPAHAEAAAQAEAWKAGTATTRITPDRPMWMAGYAARNKPSEGKVHDLHAKALALADSWGNRLVIVTLDLIGIDRLMRDWLRDQVARRYGLGKQSLLINASHTHCGPVVRVAKYSIYGNSLYGLTPDQARECRIYSEQLQEKLLHLVGDALGRLSPARLAYAHARAGFAMNRRQKTEQGYRIGAPIPMVRSTTMSLCCAWRTQTASYERSSLAMPVTVRR